MKTGGDRRATRGACALISAVLVCACGVGMFAGCAASPQSAVGVAPRPRDAMVSLAVPGSRGAWYLVEADGTLRASLGTRTLQSPAPPIVRVLSDAQWDEVWTLAREAARTPDEAAAVSSGDSDAPTSADPVFDESSAITSAMGLEVRAAGVTRRVPRPEAGAAAALEARLRSLAWAHRQ